MDCDATCGTWSPFDASHVPVFSPQRGTDDLVLLRQLGGAP